jgi:hemoglobin-like flavoprotein
MSVLSTAVANLQRWETIQRAVRALGHVHVGCRADAVHNGTVGAVLIATQQKALRVGFAPEVRDGWLALLCRDHLGDAADCSGKGIRIVLSIRNYS